MTLTAESVLSFFNQDQQTTKYIVAFSGGMDSTVLLHIMHVLKMPIYAVHVNHHLQQESDQWEQHCKSICSQWEIPLAVTHAQLKKQTSTNIEEAARNARYKLLFKFLKEQCCLVTAHHKNDLVETLLLQLLRGAGPAGLAAMSDERNAYAGKLLRPLLDYTRTELFEYATSHELRWIEDSSNESLDFDRNYLRMEIIPKLLSRWPGALQTLSRAVELQADAMECLSALASLDLEGARTKSSHILNVKVLQQLNPVRVKNALRGWIQEHEMRVPNRKMLNHIATDIVYKDEIESSPVQTWAEGEVRRYHDHLYLMKPLSIHDAKQEFLWSLDQPLHIESLDRTLSPSDLNRYRIKLPNGVQELKVCFRSGGERFKPFGYSHHRSLKNLLQEANVPPWERDRIPLLYDKDRLISVLGYWNEAEYSETAKSE